MQPLAAPRHLAVPRPLPFGQSRQHRPASADVPRTLHLVDAENLIGTAAPTEAEVRWLETCYRARVGLGPMDQVVIACSHLACKTIGFSWVGPQYRLGSGPDGADLELLSVIRHENIARRFQQVMIGSGDHIFAPYAVELAAAGCLVTVVSRRGHLSKSLKIAARRRVIYLDALDHPPAGLDAA